MLHQQLGRVPAFPAWPLAPWRGSVVKPACDWSAAQEALPRDLRLELRVASRESRRPTSRRRRCRRWRICQYRQRLRKYSSTLLHLQYSWRISQYRQRLRKPGATLLRLQECR